MDTNELGWDDEMFMLVRYPTGVLGVHPIAHKDVFWIKSVEIIAEDLTWDEAFALKALGSGHG